MGAVEQQSVLSQAGSDVHLAENAVSTENVRRMVALAF
jgi:hypothetical protein